MFSRKQTTKIKSYNLIDAFGNIGTIHDVPVELGLKGCKELVLVGTGLVETWLHQVGQGPVHVAVLGLVTFRLRVVEGVRDPARSS